MVRRAFSTPYRPLRTLPMLSLFVVGVSVLASSSQSHGPARPRIEALAPVEVLSAGLRQPMGVAIDPTGVVLVADRRGGAVYAVGPSGVHARVAGLERPVGLAVEPTGRLLVVEEQRGRLLALDGGSLAVLAHGMRRPRWVAVAGDGTVYLSARGLRHQEGARGGHLHEEDDDRDERGRDAAGDVVLRLTPGGGLAVWADGFEDLEGLLVHGDTVLAAARGRVRSRHERDGVFQIPIQPDGSAGRVTRLSPASIETPVALAIDRLGALYVGAARLALPGTPGGAIGKIDPGVNIGRFAWRLQRPQGIALDEAGHLYVADGDDGSGRLLRFRAPAPPDVTAPAVTNQSPLLLGGRTEPVARVDALLNDAHLVATATPGGGFTLTLALQPNAANALAVSATAHEGRGLTGGATELTIVHDGVGPLITAMQPANGALRSTRQPAIGVRRGPADDASADPVIP